MSNEIEVQQTDSKLIESVLVDGDLANLTPQQRVSYYQQVCKSVGLNPLTQPLRYIRLNGKLTLYAQKNAADQLRKNNNVSIDDIEMSEDNEWFTVIVKGHDATGRSDVEIGVVSKKDMQGNAGNARMKAVTKAKRRLTLSLCGLGFLDETEVETIPNADVIEVTEEGEIETPIQRGIRMYNELCAEADELGIEYEPLPENVTIDLARAMYKTLSKYVQEAKE